VGVDLPAETIRHAGTWYQRAWQSRAVAIYVPATGDNLMPAWPLLTRLERIADERRMSPRGRNPRVRVDTNGETFGSEDRFVLRVHVTPREAAAMDMYVGAVLAGGVGVVLFRAPGDFEPVAPRSRGGLLTPVEHPRGEGSHGGIVMWDGRLPPTMLPGTYRIFAALATPSRQRSIDDADFAAADVRTIVKR
jgi:hypothetical protein